MKQKGSNKTRKENMKTLPSITEAKGQTILKSDEKMMHSTLRKNVARTNECVRKHEEIQPLAFSLPSLVPGSIECCLSDHGAEKSEKKELQKYDREVPKTLKTPMCA